MDGAMFGQELRLPMDSRPVQYGKKYSPHHSTVVIFKKWHFPPSTELILTYFYFRYEVKVLDELETKLEPAVHELRLGWSTDDTDMQLGKLFYIVMLSSQSHFADL